MDEAAEGRFLCKSRHERIGVRGIFSFGTFLEDIGPSRETKEEKQM